MVYGTRQAILHKMHQIWPQCCSPGNRSFVPTGQKTAAPSASDSTTLHVPTPPSASTPTCASNVKGSTRLRQAPAVATSLEGHYPHTPIDAAHFESELRTHSDQAWCSRLLHTLRHVASIGYHGPRTPRTSKNLKSANLHPDIIDNELQSECAKSHLAGPYSSPPLPNLQCSGVGVVPKKDGSWRMMMHLSAPHLNSINDGIDKEARCEPDRCITWTNNSRLGCAQPPSSLTN